MKATPTNIAITFAITQLVARAMGIPPPALAINVTSPDRQRAWSSKHDIKGMSIRAAINVILKRANSWEDVFDTVTHECCHIKYPDKSEDEVATQTMLEIERIKLFIGEEVTVRGAL